MNSTQIAIYGDPCQACKYDWSTPKGALVEELLALENTYSAILAGLPGSARHPDLGWCASAYVLHVADNLGIHGERMAACVRGARFTFEGIDQDVLATVRRYELVPIEGALWTLGSVVTSYVAVFHDADEMGVRLPHLVRGQQMAIDVLRGNVHDAHHHGWDLQRIAHSNWRGAGNIQS